MIVSDLVLTHYDPNLPLQLACDASPVGIGAVLSHVMTDGTERPIAFASRYLSKAERNYAQIDKEALATVWGVKKFHNYLFGKSIKRGGKDIPPHVSYPLVRLSWHVPNYSGKDKWLPGIVRAQTGPLSYEIKVGPNRIWRRHIDQLRASSVKVNDQSDDTAEPHLELGETGQNIAPADEIVAERDIELTMNPPVVQLQEAGRATIESEQRYPTRSHQPPERWGLNCLIRKLFKKTT
ncbi:Hypothetical predicted protein [Paramuricea clavata]|uniref:Uncharacterized protein n=1 Tax=Paramuricea clavata TaxID=317549 RepID=A0A7D9EV13_PARCT|nr:Hypothetical predicted protein [Paramuricea clavata]